MSKIKARKFEQSRIDKKRKLKTWKKEQPGRTWRQIDPFQLSFVKVLQFRKFTLKITPWWTRKFNFDFDVEILLRWNLDKSRIKTIIRNFYCFLLYFWAIFGTFLAIFVLYAFYRQTLKSIWGEILEEEQQEASWLICLLPQSEIGFCQSLQSFFKKEKKLQWNLKAIMRKLHKLKCKK